MIGHLVREEFTRRGIDYDAEILIAPRGRVWTSHQKRVIAAAHRDRILDNFESFCLRQESRVISTLREVGIDPDAEVITMPIGCRKADLELTEVRK